MGKSMKASLAKALAGELSAQGFKARLEARRRAQAEAEAATAACPTPAKRRQPIEGVDLGAVSRAVMARGRLVDGAVAVGMSAVGFSLRMKREDALREAVQAAQAAFDDQLATRAEQAARARGTISAVARATGLSAAGVRGRLERSPLFRAAFERGLEAFRRAGGCSAQANALAVARDFDCEAIIKAVAQGGTLRSAAEAAGLSVAQLNYWRRVCPPLAEAIEAGLSSHRGRRQRAQADSGQRAAIERARARKGRHDAIEGPRQWAATLHAVETALSRKTGCAAVAAAALGVSEAEFHALVAAKDDLREAAERGAAKHQLLWGGRAGH